MRAMAVRTIGSVGIAFGVLLCVLARLIVIDLCRVAHRAIHFAAVTANGFARVAYVRMTLDAGNACDVENAIDAVT